MSPNVLIQKTNWSNACWFMFEIRMFLLGNGEISSFYSKLKQRGHFSYTKAIMKIFLKHCMWTYLIVQYKFLFRLLDKVNIFIIICIKHRFISFTLCYLQLWKSIKELKLLFFFVFGIFDWKVGTIN